MKRDWWTVAVVGALLMGAVLLGTADEGLAVEPGVAIAVPPVKSLSGEVVPMPPAKILLLDFWATWCGPCREELPGLIEVAKEFAPQGVGFVAVNLDEEDQVRAVTDFIQHLPTLGPYAVLGDAAHAEAFHVTTMPTLVVLGADGRVQASRRGAVSVAELRTLLGRVTSQDAGVLNQQ